MTVLIMRTVFLSPEDLVDSLQVSFQTLNTWRKKGTGPVFYRIGNIVRYSPEDLQKWLTERRCAAPGKTQRVAESEAVA